MRVYISGSEGQKFTCREALKEIGIETQPEREEPPAIHYVWRTHTPEQRDELTNYVHLIQSDVRDSDLLIAFRDAGITLDRRRCDVEFGLSVARGPIWIVGNRQHIFDYLPHVRQFTTWAEAFAELQRYWNEFQAYCEERTPPVFQKQEGVASCL